MSFHKRYINYKLILGALERDGVFGVLLLFSADAVIIQDEITDIVHKIAISNATQEEKIDILDSFCKVQFKGAYKDEK